MPHGLQNPAFTAHVHHLTDRRIHTIKAGSAGAAPESIQVRTSAAVVSESSSAARTAEAGTCDRDADAAGNAVTSLIPETGRSAGEWATGGGALTAPTCGAARAGGPGAPWRGSTGAGAGIGAVDGRPYPVSDWGGTGAALTEKPAPPAGTDVRSLEV